MPQHSPPSSLTCTLNLRAPTNVHPPTLQLANVSTVPSTLDSDVEAFLARVEAGDVPPKLLDSLLPTELAESADPSKTVFTEAWRSNGLTGEGWSVDQLTRATPAEVPVFSTGGDDKGLTALFRAALPQCTEKQVRLSSPSRGLSFSLPPPPYSLSPHRPILSLPTAIFSPCASPSFPCSSDTSPATWKFWSGGRQPL